MVIFIAKSLNLTKHSQVFQEKGSICLIQKGIWLIHSVFKVNFQSNCEAVNKADTAGSKTLLKLMVTIMFNSITQSKS